MSDDDKNKRETGEPGGGAGRKDEVGRSGVYPMSGPHPSGPAEIKEQTSWGQGERGAAGYEDHGGSELTFEGGQVLGGFDTGSGGEPQRQPSDIGDFEVAQKEWVAFFDGFSRQHMDWLVTVETVSSSGRLIAVVERPLKGVSIDRVGSNERAYVQVGDRPEGQMTHTIDRPTRVTFKQLPSGEHQGLEIAAADGTVTVVRFRSAMRPETLDGIAA